MHSISYFAFYTVIYVLSLAAVWFTGKPLATRGYGSDIRIVAYVFSLSLTICSLVLWWALSTGVVQGTNRFTGRFGPFIESLMEDSTDLHTEGYILGALLALLVIPQFLAYFLSGLYGCASAPIFLDPVFRFVFWSIVKFCAVAAGVNGIFWGYSAYAFSRSLDGTSVKTIDGTPFDIALGNSLASPWWLWLALFLILVYRFGRALLKRPGIIGRVLRRINIWANRNLPPHRPE